MPYQKSQARKNFDAEIDYIISVIKASFKNKATLSNTNEFVLSCGIMLGSAKIETYIEDFFDMWIQKINNTSTLINSNLPDNLRALYLNQSFLQNAFKQLINEKNESKYIDGIARELSNSHFHLTDESKLIPNLNSNMVYQNKKYPSPDNMKALFKRAGINNIFNELNRSIKTDSTNILQSYNDFRTAIAHNGIPVGINSKDVIEKLNGIKTLIRHIDKILYKHVRKHTSAATWTT